MVVPAFTMLLCTMVRNESNYLVEWVEFHKLQGFDEVLIYDNTGPRDGTPSISETLTRAYASGSPPRTLAQAGVTVQPLSGTSGAGAQITAFRKCTAHGEAARHEWQVFGDAPRGPGPGHFAAAERTSSSHVQRAHGWPCPPVRMHGTLCLASPP